MKAALGTAGGTLIAALAATAAILIAWLLLSTVDRIGLAAFLLRFVHVAAAMVWFGMIWFVNFIQLAAVEASDAGGRAALLQHVVPRVAATFRYASHLT